ncbi:50S ribosomal protein L3 [bacterium]|nr:MAG: 50S ribosomal protein L3 [bacterium]QQR62045.1 MAG: 50S ribosomal protein L3 [bacterium]
MVNGLWGQKIGMTQLFVDGKAVPVTAVNVGHWIVCGTKTVAQDGYNALQVGCLRKRYRSIPFDLLWLKNKQKYFFYTKEVRCSSEQLATAALGSVVDLLQFFAIGDLVRVSGLSKGIGFAGVYKRHNFGGAAKSHGSMMGRRPGSIGFTRSSGEIMRGQMMAGHAGNKRISILNLTVVKILQSENVLMIKGSVPGKSGTLVFVKRQGL